jgi:hypothetical protein
MHETGRSLVVYENGTKGLLACATISWRAADYTTGYLGVVNHANIVLEARELGRYSHTDWLKTISSRKDSEYLACIWFLAIQ